MKTRERRAHLAAATVLKSLGDQSEKVQSIAIDGTSIDLAEAMRVDRDQGSSEVKLPQFVQRLVDKQKKAAPSPATTDVETKKPSWVMTRLRESMTRVRESQIVGKALNVIRRDAATVTYRSAVDITLKTGASEHFTLDGIDGAETRRLRSVLLASDLVVALPLPPGFTSILLAPVALISAVAAVISGMRGDTELKAALKRMTYKELALIPLGEVDPTGISGVTAFAADLTAAITPSQAQAVTVGEISRWVAAAPASAPA